jgi:hypothetical protein
MLTLSQTALFFCINSKPLHTQNTQQRYHKKEAMKNNRAQSFKLTKLKCNKINNKALENISISL